MRGICGLATTEGAIRYDGERYTVYDTTSGLVNNGVTTIFQDRQGNIWLNIWGSGVSRYDGKTFVNLTEEDGLAYDWVYDIHQDREGYVWFGTGQRGKSLRRGSFHDVGWPATELGSRHSIGP